MLARLVTMSDPAYRAGMPGPLAADDPVAALRPGVIDVAVHGRAAPAGEVVSALASAADAPQADLDTLIDTLLQRREPFTMAVDALDEADDPRALARALPKLASKTADADVRLLVGTRPGGPGPPADHRPGPVRQGQRPGTDRPGYLWVPRISSVAVGSRVAVSATWP